MNQRFQVPLHNPGITLEWVKQHFTGRGVRVAVIDSGIDVTHPDLVGLVKRAAVIDQVDADQHECREIPVEESEDSFGHGTGVAGVIRVLAPEAELMSIRMLNEYNRGSGEALIAALAWALKQDVDIINLSLTTSRKMVIPSLFELCELAYQKDILIVSSKRNFGDLGCPAMFSSVISVDIDLKIDDPWQLRFLPKSTIEFAAHGTNIQSPTRGGGYQLQTGTSFATPHVTGICALLREAFPGINSWEAKTILKSICIDR